MREFSQIARRGLAAAADATHLLFRRIDTKVLWAITTLALFLIPATTYGWWNNDSLVPNLQPQGGVGQSGVPTLLKDASINADVTVNQANIPTAISEPQGAKMGKPSVQAQVRVNGQSMSIPENGSIHKEINNENSKTTVDISVDSSSSGSSQSNSSMNIDFNSVTQSSVDGNTP